MDIENFLTHIVAVISSPTNIFAALFILALGKFWEVLLAAFFDRLGTKTKFIILSAILVVTFGGWLLLRTFSDIGSKADKIDEAVKVAIRPTFSMGGLEDFALSDDGKVFIGINKSDKTAQIFSTTTLKPVATLDIGLTAQSYSNKLIVNENYVVADGAYGFTKIFDWTNGRKLLSASGYPSLRYMDKELVAVSGSYNHPEHIDAVNTTNGEVMSIDLPSNAKVVGFKKSNKALWVISQGKALQIVPSGRTFSTSQSYNIKDIQESTETSDGTKLWGVVGIFDDGGTYIVFQPYIFKKSNIEYFHEIKVIRLGSSNTTVFEGQCDNVYPWDTGGSFLETNKERSNIYCLRKNELVSISTKTWQVNGTTPIANSAEFTLSPNGLYAAYIKADPYGTVEVKRTSDGKTVRSGNDPKCTKNADEFCPKKVLISSDGSVWILNGNGMLVREKSSLH